MMGKHDSQRGWTTLRRFAHDQQGPTATEYAVMLALVLLAVVIAVGLLGLTVHDLYAAATGADW